MKSVYIIIALVLMIAAAALLKEGKTNFNSSSAAERKESEAKIAAILRDSDPRGAFAFIRKNTRTESNLLHCHALTHQMGHWAYAKYGDFAAAAQYDDPLCGFGYLHGVIESHFEASADIELELQTLCEKYKKRERLALTCTHGMGHGLMFYHENDLPKSLDLCGQIEDSAYEKQCASGVFMANFTAREGIHPSDYLKDDDLFYPCGSVHADFKWDCYMNAPLNYWDFYPRDYKGAMKWCGGAGEFADACAYGVGAYASLEVASRKIEKLCAGKPEWFKECVSGALNFQAQIAGGDSGAAKEKFCGSFKNKSACLSS